MRSAASVSYQPPDARAVPDQRLKVGDCSPPPQLKPGHRDHAFTAQAQTLLSACVRQPRQRNPRSVISDVVSAKRSVRSGCNGKIIEASNSGTSFLAKATLIADFAALADRSALRHLTVLQADFDGRFLAVIVGSCRSDRSNSTAIRAGGVSGERNATTVNVLSKIGRSAARACVRSPLSTRDIGL